MAAKDAPVRSVVCPACGRKAFAWGLQGAEQFLCSLGHGGRVETELKLRPEGQEDLDYLTARHQRIEHR